MYYSICAYCKDETPYLEEFINFNRATGAEHFFIYDNCSKIPVDITLKSYIDQNIVTVIDFPGQGLQTKAYQHYIENFEHLSKWIAFIDCDEYMIPKAQDDMKLILQDYEDFGALAVNWMLFGSSGHLTKPNKLISESYTKCELNNHIKSIVQPYRVKQKGPDPHHFIYGPPFYAVNEHKSKVHQAWSYPPSNDICQLNHYFTKSLEEYKIKISRGHASNPNGIERGMEDFYQTDENCDLEDFSAFKFINKCKELYL